MEIYSFLNYRDYISALYDTIKGERWFSCRSFADQLGIANPGYVNDVISGRRRLSKGAAEKIANYFKLSNSEQRYLLTLILYEHAKDETKREEFLNQLNSLRKRSRFAEGAQEYFTDIRFSLVRTALQVVEFSGDYELLLRTIRIRISKDELKRIIRKLCQWNMVEQRNDGRYVVTDRFVEPSPELGSTLMALHRDWIALGANAVTDIPREKRTITSQLMAVSAPAESAIQKELELFRERVWNIVEQDREDADRLVQLNLQLFPQTNNRK